MCFFWLHFCESQKQLKYYWRTGTNNRADYWSKHHCAAHHIKKRPTLLTSKFILDALRASTNRTPATSGKGLLSLAPAARAA